jgi:ubiquinone/menaquinone biosynthesis C-methylase UbiE
MIPLDTAILRCIDCAGALTASPSSFSCESCGARWPIRNGMPMLFREENVRGLDRLMRFIYDLGPSFHDPAVKYLLPFLQLGSSEKMRDRYMRRMELDRLEPPAGGRPICILEVGIGAGANIPLITRDLPPKIPYEIWGVDLSAGMLRSCRRMLERTKRRDVRLAMADAHALPFRDHSFDRVLHVGGIGGFRAPRQALAEMARVARPGTPIVVVDEQLDPALARSRYFRNVYRLVTLHDQDAHAPRDELPAEAIDVLEEQVSRFYYCLTFRLRGP